jgi:ribonucleoside-diphosphate reductase alpha chain
MTELTELQQKIFNDRYALRDSAGTQVETTPEQMWRRVAKRIASVESSPEAQQATEESFYRLMQDWKFLPGGRIFAGAGTENEVTYFNCFVVNQPEDSRGGITDTLKEMIEIMSRGGGVGINFSSLRPHGSYISTINGTSSGPVAWMEMFSVVTGRVISQGGSRRGALMIMLDDDHPDIEKFIDAKDIDPLTNKPRMLEHANVSIAISDDFMAAVKAGEKWQTQFPTRANQDAYHALHGTFPNVIYGPEYDAAELFAKICEHAHRTAEPGLVFMERYNRESNTWYYENIRCTNPCGEQGLPAWGVCNLGAMNLAAYVTYREPNTRGEASKTRGDLFAEFDFAAFEQDVQTATRFLDNVIDATPYFFDENEQQQRYGTRRTGLGTMGLADAMVKLGIRYGSEESLQFIDDVYSTLRDAAYEASVALAVEKKPFSKFDKDKYAKGQFITTLPDYLQANIYKHGIRNGVILTQAPTGTTSMLAGVSSGIEPIFSFHHQRVDRLGTHDIYHPLVEEYLAQHPGEELPEYFVNSATLTPDDHVKVQARIQRYTDSSISKTVNAPNDHTVESVMKLYMDAYDLGCKGITYYRDGSRDAVLTHINDQGAMKEDTQAVQDLAAIVALEDQLLTISQPRPKRLVGETFEADSPSGNMYLTINKDEFGPREVFVTVGRGGSDTNAEAEALGRLISLVLNVDPLDTREQRLEKVRHQLNGIGGSRSVGFGKKRIASLPDAVSKVLDEYLYSDEPVKELPQTLDTVPSKVLLMERKEITNGERCADCGAVMAFVEGCAVCYSCGASKC